MEEEEMAPDNAGWLKDQIRPDGWVVFDYIADWGAAEHFQRRLLCFVILMGEYNLS